MKSEKNFLEKLTSAIRNDNIEEIQNSLKEMADLDNNVYAK